MHGLTRRQTEILGYINRQYEKNGIPPTLREIGNATGIGSTNGVNDHLEALKKKGFLKRYPQNARSNIPVRSFVTELRDELRVKTMSIAKAVEWAAANLGEDEQAELLIILGVAKSGRRGE